MEIKTIGVVGCGLMGSGIAQVCALAGYETIVYDATAAALERGTTKIRKSVGDAVTKGKMLPGAVERLEMHLKLAKELDAFSHCDVVIEAIVEDATSKQTAYTQLAAVLRNDAVLFSNTSSLPITYLATLTDRRDRFAGLHFFNPVPAMKLVEIIRGLATSDATYETAVALSRSLEKEPVTAPDRSGFIVNRLLIPYLLDAIREFEGGHGSREDIDMAMKLGCGHPMGPLTLTDFIGLDTTLAIANIMFEEYREPRFAPPPLLNRMVASGALGRKAGRGFYSYG